MMTGPARPDATEVAGAALVLGEASFGYDGHPAVSGLNLSVMPGEAVAVIGANGSGKSTLLKGLLGLVPRLSGTMAVAGTGRRGTGGRGLGYLPQSDAIDPELPVTLRQIVTMGRYRGLGLFRWAGAADRRMVREALETVGMGSHAGARFGDLSGGQRQRGLLARAIASEPAILLLDEPFNGLDRPNRTALIEALRRLKEQGVAILVSTHDLEIAREVCDSVLLLEGRQIAYGPRDKVLTLENVQATFANVQVEIDGHTLVTPGHEVFSA
ncbi:metal ABC transporter ATP-binding protein [Paeniglutamicibacter sulfureus]|uniref:Manganese/iron transport system ATP-binding protein n=1 Tax=Paeniglutamicibacter sulfureus TaxID=43666 RepID=A0ABU2BML5_9MICC|nr:metal ABC transporter ATP-binding protein [Paeniglutamicibacter sulfureus]MDO2935174.1 metal ABC transporter ATP-binding protein [Paeniglutamicibacter sulfureus]MDR7359486.1 manganese/iron transport system ATP-binding protein [Paeniglutamicibacter sulfureus]